MWYKRRRQEDKKKKTSEEKTHENFENDCEFYGLET